MTVSPNNSFHSCVTAQPKELMKDGVMCDAQVGVGLAVQINRLQDFSTGLWSLMRKRINHLDKLSCCLPWHAQDHSLIETY